MNRREPPAPVAALAIAGFILAACFWLAVFESAGLFLR